MHFTHALMNCVLKTLGEVATGCSVLPYLHKQGSVLVCAPYFQDHFDQIGSEPEIWFPAGTKSFFFPQCEPWLHQWGERSGMQWKRINLQKESLSTSLPRKQKLHPRTHTSVRYTTEWISKGSLLFLDYSIWDAAKVLSPEFQEKVCALWWQILDYCGSETHGNVA